MGLPLGELGCQAMNTERKGGWAVGADGEWLGCGWRVREASLGLRGRVARLWVQREGGLAMGAELEGPGGGCRLTCPEPLSAWQMRQWHRGTQAASLSPAAPRRLAPGAGPTPPWCGPVVGRPSRQWGRGRDGWKYLGVLQVYESVRLPTPQTLSVGT